MISTLSNSLWLTGCLAEFVRFRHAAGHVAEEQQAVLRRLLSANAHTDFGRRHGFSSIRSIREYQQRVPLRDYDAYEEWITRVAAGAPDVLTREPVRLFEPTSGSSGATKLIPYTATLQREFQRAIRAWIADLFLHQPALLRGQAYWSISPVAPLQRKTSGNIPIGFADDAAYVGGWQQRLAQTVMAVPAAVRQISGMDAFRYVTLLFLLRSSSLRLISVWNPTFLSLLVERLPEWGELLAHDLEHGKVNPSFAIPDDLRQAVHPKKRRAAEVREALRCSTPSDLHRRLWPQLGLISCWSDANAAAPGAHLATLFPQARIQGKGLIATEGFISFPITGHEGSALAVRSHFLEFFPVDSAGVTDTTSPELAHELECRQRYSVALTTGGGLYRYQLHDVIEVTGHFRNCPTIRFIGREGYVSDWFGEKLNEAHVSKVLQETFAWLDMSPAFAMLACDTRAPAGYVLYIDAGESDDVLEHAAARIEAGLCSNFHYDYARALGQLCAVRVFRAPDAAKTYLSSAIRNGRRAGDVKPLALDRDDGWTQVFRGEFVHEAVPANA